MRTKKHGVVEHTTSSFFRTAVVIKCTKDMLQINAIFNLLTTYYRTVFVICNLSKRVLYIKVLILI